MIPCCFRRKFTGESPEYIIVTPVSFDGFNLNITGNDDYFSPVFTMAKFQQEGDRVPLPVSVQVHQCSL